MRQEPLRKLNGSTIVTGGAPGLERACVERLRAEGMPVLVADVKGVSGTDLARADEGVEFRRTDVRNADEVDAAVQQPPASPLKGCGSASRARESVRRRGFSASADLTTSIGS